MNTIIGRIVNGRVAEDGQQVSLKLEDTDAHDFDLRLPMSLVPGLVEICAAMLTLSARQGQDVDSKLRDSVCQFNVGFWKMFPDKQGGVSLSLTIENGGVLAFNMPAHLAESLLGFGRQKPKECERIGFGQ